MFRSATKTDAVIALPSEVIPLRRNAALAHSNVLTDRVVDQLETALLAGCPQFITPTLGHVLAIVPRPVAHDRWAATDSVTDVFIVMRIDYEEFNPELTLPVLVQFEHWADPESDGTVVATTYAEFNGYAIPVRDSFDISAGHARSEQKRGLATLAWPRLAEVVPPVGRPGAALLR